MTMRDRFYLCTFAEPTVWQSLNFDLRVSWGRVEPSSGISEV